MEPGTFARQLLGIANVFLAASQALATEQNFDVVVYSATPAGVAYCSVRVEPCWMMLGQSAGVAAAMAAKKLQPVQELNHAALRERLLAQKQVLDLPESIPAK